MPISLSLVCKYDIKEAHGNIGLVGLCSTEITRYRSWFLEHKLTRGNSVPKDAHDEFSISKTSAPLFLDM